jgi:hypothetical protein
MRLPSGLIAIKAGEDANGIVVSNVFVAVLMTETELELILATYTRVPSGLIVTAPGNAPTDIAATVTPVLKLITDNVLLDTFVMYAKPGDGRAVAVMVAVTGLLPVFIAVNEGILPVPFAAKPMVVLLFVQVYTHAPPGKFIGFVLPPFVTISWAFASLKEKKKNSIEDKMSKYFFM